MSTADQKTILQFMTTMYPEPLDLDALYRSTGIDDTRVRRAMWGLVARGFIDVGGSPSWIGLPWTQPRLSAAGMAVASGVASMHEDALDVIERLEGRTLNQLHALGRSGAAIP